MRMTLFLLSLMAHDLLSQRAEAAWSSQTLQTFKSMQGQLPAHNPDLATLWGGVKRFFKGEGLDGDELELSLKGFHSPLEVYIHINEKKAPLMIFFPGIFGTHEGSVSPWLINGFEARGFHTASVPNFLSRPYIKARPDYGQNGAAVFDVAAALEASEKIIERIGPQRVDSVVLVGESLGAFLLSGAGAQLSDYPLLKSKTTKAMFLWPPLNVKKALKAFDNKSSETKKTYEQCSYLLRLPLFLYEFWWKENPEKLADEDSRCFEAYLFHGAFLKSMGKSFDARASAYGLEDPPRPEGFADFVKGQNPFYKELLESDDKRLHFSHWLGHWSLTGVDIKVVSSEDDFINDPKDWEDIKGEFLFDWGGHCAPVAQDGFMEALVKEAM